MNESELKKSKSVLGDIIKGYSIIRSGEERVYLKHLNFSENIELDEFEDETFEDAIISGIKSEKALLARAEELGNWSKKHEEEINSLKFVIEKTNASVKKTADPSTRSLILKSVEEAENQLEAAQKTKDKITGFSAESLAFSRRCKEMMKKSLFRDKDFKVAIEGDDYEKFGLMGFLKTRDFYDDDIMLRACYNNMFFELFMYQHRNPIAIFNKTIQNINVHQSRLISYASLLYNKLKNTPDIPKKILQDAVDLFNYTPLDKSKGDQGQVKDGLSDLINKSKKGEEITLADL